MPRDQKDWNRIELKYRMPAARIPEWVAALGDYVRPDPNDADGRGYPIYSIYADSPGLTFFWEKIEGLKYRRKVRFRRYGSSPDVWIEIKQRIDRTVQKRRIRWPVERVERAFFGGGLDESALPEHPDRILSEVLFLWRTHGLEPTMGTSYRRRAFFARGESDLRITLDSRVCFHPTALTLGERSRPEKYIVEPEESILEIKYTHSVPLWLCRLVEHFELSLVRLSKYCTAVDKQRFRGRLT